MGIWELVLDDLDDSHDSTIDLFRCVAMIVGADPQHHNLTQETKEAGKDSEHKRNWPLDINVPGIEIFSTKLSTMALLSA